MSDQLGRPLVLRCYRLRHPLNQPRRRSRSGDRPFEPRREVAFAEDRGDGGPARHSPPPDDIGVVMAAADCTRFRSCSETVVAPAALNKSSEFGSADQRERQHFGLGAVGLPSGC